MVQRLWKLWDIVHSSDFGSDKVASGSSGIVMDYSTGGVEEPKSHLVKLNGQFMAHVKQLKFPRHKWTKFRDGLGGKW